jgi:hypothetical protein
MAEEGTPEILAEQRLGHQVPGMRGLYAHVTDRMRAELMHVLQNRWEESLEERAAIHPRSLVPILDELLTPLRIEKRAAEQRMAQRQTSRLRPAPRIREKMISQIPPRPPGNRAQAARMNKKPRRI